MRPRSDDSCLSPWRHRSRAQERGQSQKLEICPNHNPEDSLLSQWKHLPSLLETRSPRKMTSKSLDDLHPSRWRPRLGLLAGTQQTPWTSPNPKVDLLRSPSRPHRAVAEADKSKVHHISNLTYGPLQLKAAARRRRAPLSHHMIRSPQTVPKLCASSHPSYWTPQSAPAEPMTTATLLSLLPTEPSLATILLLKSTGGISRGM
jgi:hypothetical protein